MHIYIYIYIERERESERGKERRSVRETLTHIYIKAPMPVCTYIGSNDFFKNRKESSKINNLQSYILTRVRHISEMIDKLVLART